MTTTARRPTLRPGYPPRGPRNVGGLTGENARLHTDAERRRWAAARRHLRGPVGHANVRYVCILLRLLLSRDASRPSAQSSIKHDYAFGDDDPRVGQCWVKTRSGGGFDFDSTPNDSRTAVESKPNHSCNRRLTGRCAAIVLDITHYVLRTLSFAARRH